MKLIVKDSKVKETLLFEEIDQIKRLNILVGGNGVGKTTLLKAIRDNKVDLGFSYKSKVYINSIDNIKVSGSFYGQDKGTIYIQDIYDQAKAKVLSEGQTIMYFVTKMLSDLTFEVTKLKDDEKLVVILDEVDSGLSVENIYKVLIRITEVAQKSNRIIFFLSSNNYQFTYLVKEVINMYTGEYIRINSYEDYVQLITKGTAQMIQSGRRRSDDYIR